MLKSFTIENVYSFLEPAKLSLELNAHATDDGLSFVSPATQVRASKCLAVVGANASGKTNFLQALSFLMGFIIYSFRREPDDPIPLAPHFSAKDKPSSFEVEFEWEMQTWRYCLKTTRERVLHESLHAKLPGSRFSHIFVRNWEMEKQSYTVKLERQKFDFLPTEAVKVRPNASLISAAAQYNVELAKKLLSLNVYRNFFSSGKRENVEPENLFRASEFYKDNADIRDRMVRLLTGWDLGLSDVRIEKHPLPPTPRGAAWDIYIPFGIHRIGDKEHALEFFYESSGTQSAFLLLSSLLPALQNGGLAIIDELEAHLHPHMLPAILDLFFSPRTNPRNAQILFTTHSLDILNRLHKSQIAIVEKNNRCESETWRLDSMKGVRSDDNFYAKYMAGAYGGVPRL